MKVNIEQNNKGLNQDIDVTLQPEGTSRFRLNALPETKEGELGFMPNEAGNKQCYDLTTGFYPIGEIPILDDKTIIFSVNPDTNISEIGVVQNCVYTVLISSACLAFDITKQIRGIFRVREGCNTNIYFTDNTNPWRAIDIDNLTQYLATGFTTAALANADANRLGWDCNSFKLFRNYDQSNIDMQVFNTGGNTNVGMYQFTYQYLDDDFNPQPWLTPSNPIPIVKDSLNEYTGLDGDETGTVTNKSIQLTLSNLDDRYSYVRIGLIVSDFGTGFNSNAYILEELPIEDNTINYLFQGIDPNKTRNTDLESFTFLPPDYYTGKDLNQIDNSLSLAYPRARDIDYVPFIQAGLNITATYKVRDLFAESTGQESYSNRYPNSYYYNKSLMRDEVYAFGIVFIFNDGTETPAFHIPGRAANTKADGVTPINSIDYDNINLPTGNLHNRLAATAATGPNAGEWDTAQYDITDPSVGPNIIDDAQKETTNNVDYYVQRWKIFNTAIRTGWDTTTDNYVATGELAYWESQDYNYPGTDVVDCTTGLPVYGDLAGTPVRYHKMPDATLEPHYWGYSTTSNPHPDGFAYIRPLNIQFDNIVIPAEYADEVQGYRIVRVERNEYNSSVLDKGILLQDQLYTGTGSNSSFRGRTQGFPFNQKLDALGDSVPTESGIDDISTSSGLQEKSFHSPTTKLYKDAVQGDYIKFERSIWTNQVIDYAMTSLGTNESISRVYYDENSDTYAFISPNDSVRYALAARYNESFIPKPNVSISYTNRVINKQSYVPANDVVADGLEYPFYANFQNESFGIDLNDDINSSILGTSIVADWSVKGMGFQFTTQFTPEDTEFVRLISNTFKTGAYYTALKRYLPNQYNGIHQLVYSCPGTIDTDTSHLYSNGDCFINDWGFKKYCDFADSGGGFMAAFDTAYDTPNRFTIRSVVRFWCESPINMELRNDGDLKQNSFYDTYIGDSGDEFNASEWYYPKNYNENKGNMRGFLVWESEWNRQRFGTSRNYYAYNKDFSIENTVRSFFPLPINFDYCNTCLVKYPHRLANSNKAYQEERADNYRIFLPNNYRDIPGETGNINEIFIKDNKLFIHTTQSLWYQQVKPQQIKTDQATLYVGTGEFWEIPPNEIMTSLNGYAGCQHQVGTINTPFGYFYPSERERKVFLFNDKLSEISNEGLRNWFETNLPLQLAQQYPLVPTDNPANPAGIGFTVAYDKRHRRIIFSKKDFKAIDPDNTAYFPDSNSWAVTSTNPTSGDSVITVVELGNSTYFENKSWTISYHPETNTWTSWHSYLPNFMYNDQNNFYTFSSQDTTDLNVRKSWIHNVEYDTDTSTNNFQKFYDTTFPYINEIIFNKQAIAVNTFPTISWYSINTEYNEATGQWVEVNNTFDEAVIYNNNQSTGDLTLINQTTPFQTVTAGNQSLVKRTEKLWSINRYRDYAIGTPVFTTAWAALQAKYYVDKVVNTANIDLSKSPFETEKFRDEYLACRLIYNNDNNTKLLTKFIFDTQKVSPR